MSGRKSLREKKMSEAALIEDARKWANEMVLRESRGPGDMDNAMRRIATRYGLEPGTLWGLRYRPPKRIFADIYFRLRDAYQAERERQLRLLEHEIAITKAKAGPDRVAVRAAETVVAASRGIAPNGKVTP